MSQSTGHLHIEYIPLSALKPYEKNPRYNDEVIAPLMRSIQEFGFNQPIVVDKDYVIIVGHARYYAALKLQLEKVPVYIASYLMPAQARAYRLEDTDLSLRILKDGWCTVQFIAFLAKKVRTQLIKGGNTQEFYSRYGTLPKSKMLVMLHPDVTRLTWKFRRWHHEVDYSPFKKNKLIPNLDYITPLDIEYEIISICGEQYGLSQAPMGSDKS